MVGVLPQGFPLPTVPAVGLADLALLAAAAVGISLVAIGDTISTSAGFAARKGYDVDSNQELRGIGAANLLAGVFQGFPVSTSGSRTAVAEQSGAKTQLTGLVAAGAVTAMLLFAPGLVRNLPQSALAAIIIAASVRLFDTAELRRLWRARRPSSCWPWRACWAWRSWACCRGLSSPWCCRSLGIFLRAWRPYSAVLGRPASVAGYHDITRYPDALLVPGLVMLRWDAPLFFANAGLFRDRVRQLAAERGRPDWIVVAAEPVTDLDATAADVLLALDQELRERGIRLVFADSGPVRDRLVRYGLLEAIEPRDFFPTVRRGGRRGLPAGGPGRTKRPGMTTFADVLRESRFTPELVPPFDRKLFYEGARRRPYLERFGVLLVLSVVIATAGVLGDSTATVIGAMIVAPLMTPIMATTAALSPGAWTAPPARCCWSAPGWRASSPCRSCSDCCTAASSTSLATARSPPGSTPSCSTSWRRWPRAAPGAFCLSREDVANSLPGVAIAISLVPPLCVVGISLSARESGGGRGRPAAVRDQHAGHPAGRGGRARPPGPAPGRHRRAAGAGPAQRLPGHRGRDAPGGRAPARRAAWRSTATARAAAGPAGGEPGSPGRTSPCAP